MLDSCRYNAEAALVKAERVTLTNVRARAAEAASRGSEMADGLERVEAEGQIKSDTAARAKEVAR